MRYRIPLLFVLLWSGVSALAQTTLQDCIHRGLENNYQLKIVRNQEAMAHNNATLANAGALPSLDLAGGYRHDDNIYGNATLSWTLFDGFRIQTTLKQLRLLEQQGETATRMAVEDLTADIASEYYNYIRQIIRRGNYRIALQLSRERLRIAELNYQTGRFSGLDYHLARIDFHSDSSAYVSQREAVHTSRIRLNQLMANANLEERIRIPDSTIVVNDTLLYETLWQQTQQANAELLNAAQNTRMAELDYRKVVSRNYPYLRLNESYGVNYATRKYENWDFSGGISVGINVFDGNRRRERRNAKLAIENRQLQAEQLKLSLQSELRTCWRKYRYNLDLLELQRENLRIAEDNLEISMERYKLGNLSGFDMRQVQRNLLDAEEKVLQVEYEAKICEISLMLMSGNIEKYW